MKYIIYTAVVLAIWALVECIIPVVQGRGGRVSIRERLTLIGRQIHSTAGILAILIIVFFVVRLLVQVVMR